MKIEEMPAEFKHARPILKTLVEHGYEAYFVGGAVRDTLLGRPIHDVDIATSAYPSEVKALFKKTVDTGIEHGTVMILDHGQGYETTTFRTETGYSDFRRPDQVNFVRSLKEDLKRRDFTVNALAMDGDGQIVDLFGGLTDLKAGLIRAVGSPKDRFFEDALRMIRAVRFAAQLGFKIEPATLVAIKENAPLLDKIAIERVNVEFTKMMEAPGAYFGFIELLAGELNHYMPGLTVADIDLLGYADLVKQARPQNDQQAWTLLAFELGLTAEDTVVFLKGWKHSRHLIVTAQKSITLLNKLRMGPVSNWDLYITGKAIDTALAVAKLSELVVDVATLQARYDQLSIKQSHDLALTGSDLMREFGLKPGPLVGTVLSKLERAVVDGKVANQAASLGVAAQKLIKEEKD